MTSLSLDINDLRNSGFQFRKTTATIPLPSTNTNTRNLVIIFISPYLNKKIDEKIITPLYKLSSNENIHLIIEKINANQFNEMQWKKIIGKYNAKRDNHDNDDDDDDDDDDNAIFEINIVYYMGSTTEGNLQNFYNSNEFIHNYQICVLCKKSSFLCSLSNVFIFSSISCIFYFLLGQIFNYFEIDVQKLHPYHDNNRNNLNFLSPRLKPFSFHDVQFGIGVSCNEHDIFLLSPDGFVYHVNSNEQTLHECILISVTKLPCPYQVGDRIGCGYDATNQSIYWTKNGEYLGCICLHDYLSKALTTFLDRISVVPHLNYKKEKLEIITKPNLFQFDPNQLSIESDCIQQDTNMQSRSPPSLSSSFPSVLLLNSSRKRNSDPNFRRTKRGRGGRGGRGFQEKKNLKFTINEFLSFQLLSINNINKYLPTIAFISHYSPSFTIFLRNILLNYSEITKKKSKSNNNNNNQRNLLSSYTCIDITNYLLFDKIYQIKNYKNSNKEKINSYLNNENLALLLQIHPLLKRLNIEKCEKINHDFPLLFDQRQFYNINYLSLGDFNYDFNFNRFFDNLSQFNVQISHLKCKSICQYDFDLCKILFLKDSLRFLDLTKSSSLDCKSFCNLIKELRLHSLILYQCENLNHNDCLIEIKNSQSNSLQFLSIDRIHFMPQDIASFLDNSMLKLQYLSIGSWNVKESSVDNLVLKKIADYHNNIKGLNIYRCFNITDDAFINLIDSCPNLVELNIGYLRKISDKAFYSIINLKNLKYLSLVRNSHINEDIIYSILKHLSCTLTEISLQGCHQISKEKLYSICNFIKPKYLCLKGTQLDTEQGIELPTALLKFMDSNNAIIDIKFENYFYNNITFIKDDEMEYVDEIKHSQWINENNPVIFSHARKRSLLK